MTKIVFLKGGFGNQLFQFFEAFNNCSTVEDKIILDESLLSHYPSKRRFELSFVLNDYTTVRKTLLLDNKLSRYTLELASRLRIINGDKGKGIISNVYFGYFQKKDAFLQEKSRIKLNQLYSTLKSNLDIEKLESISNKFDFSYHLRLSDRYSLKVLRSFEEYIISNHSFNDKILIFTDSPQQVQELKGRYNITLSHSLSLSLPEEFYLLSTVKNIQISSSTFSVFARLLSGKEFKFIKTDPMPGDEYLKSEFNFHSNSEIV